MGNTPKVLLDSYISKCDPRRQTRVDMQVALHSEGVDGRAPSSSGDDDASLPDQDEMNAAGDVGMDDDNESQSTGCDSLAYASCLEDESDADSPSTAGLSLSQLLPKQTEVARSQGREVQWVKVPGKPYLSEDQARALSLLQLRKVFLRMYGAPPRSSNKAWYIKKVTGKDVKERKQKAQHGVACEKKRQSHWWLK